MTIYDLLDELRATAHDLRDQGDKFERLIRAFLRIDPLYREKFSDVWLWHDWPGRNGRPDCGIDLVAQQADSDDLWAIQCKFWEHAVSKEDIDSFFTESGKRPFTKRLIVATSPFSKHAEEAFHEQWTDVHTLTLDDLDRSAIDWGQFSWTHPAVLQTRQPKTPRPHQKHAITAVLDGFQSSDRGKLIMACGTGKTFTSLQIAEAMVPGQGGTVLVLTPSIALVSQTLREWTAEARRPLRSYAVCSDGKVGKSEEDLRPSDLAFPATTDSAKLAAEIRRGHTAGAITVIFSTYQSIAVVRDAQEHYGLPTIDLVICDEAHRTVGTSQKTAKGLTQSAFTLVHEDRYLRAQKRLYMTATPRIYSDDTKRKADDHSVVLYSMDNEAVFGPEFHRLTFSEAVEDDILADYKVLILTVDETEALALFGEDIHDEKKLDAKLTDEAKIIGCLRAFAKRFPKDDDDDMDSRPMQRVVAFTNTTNDSKHIRNLLNQVTMSLPPDAEDLLSVESHHVDGSMNVATRNAELTWLKGSADDAACRVLTNARCLTEGVDVPSLDAVVFLQPRDSQVDVVQAVGRVMRKAPGKQFGYVVLPVVIPAGKSPEEALEDRKEYKVVWQVLNALRSHDDRFNDMINHLEFNKKSRKVRVVGKPGHRDAGTDQIHFQWSPEELQRAFYAKLVQRVGDRQYWDEWARKVAAIVERYRTHILHILESADGTAPDAQAVFQQFLAGLHDNVNDSISRDEAIDMLAQHLVTKPVFDALFADYAFTTHNPVSRSMERVLEMLDDHALWKEKDAVTAIEGKLLDQLHREIARQAGDIDTAAGKQQFIIKIYDKFFRGALKKTAARLGIVYTPVEIVDFILHSVEALLQEEFGQHLTDENVHILDPFTGTGTFLVRLLQSGLIQPGDRVRKFRHELHANEIVLLAYYLAAINIEQTFHAVAGKDYEPFPGIVLTDTFQQGEARKNFFRQEYLPENNARLAGQNQTEIRVIVGNPPYSVGQDNANDNNQNIKYPLLDDRIRDTYAAHSTAVNKNSLYDSYIRAFRWASDRIGDQGIIGFVTNAGWVDGNTMDGFRKILAEEFTDIYVFHLRGNARTQGDTRKREAGNVFKEGSRAPVAINLLVKNPQKRSRARTIHFHDIGDYLSREDKLTRVAHTQSLRHLAWTILQPNAQHDWLNQRSDTFEYLIPLMDENASSIFSFRSRGVETSRDAWVYNFDQDALAQNIRRTVAVYNDHLAQHGTVLRDAGKAAEKVAREVIDTNPRHIKWTSSLIADLIRGRHGEFHLENIGTGLYRPFCKQHVYYDRVFNHRYKERFFPSVHHTNLAIDVPGPGETVDFSCLIISTLPNLHTMSGGQCFPLYMYEKKDAAVDDLVPGVEGGYTRKDAITDWALRECRVRYGPSVSKEDIFYYVYGLLHSPDYRSRFTADLKKILPRIPWVDAPENFWAFSHAGRELAHWHLDYETVEPWPVDEETADSPPRADTLFRVEKMRFGKAADGKVDKTTIHYNPFITLRLIPLEAYDYVVNGKSALDWVMDRYQVKTDKDSGIVNDPNEWAEDPRYIVDLVKRVVRVSMETLRVVEGLPGLEFDR